MYFSYIIKHFHFWHIGGLLLKVSLTHICQATAKSNVNYFKLTYLFWTLINATKQIDLPAVIFNDPHCFPFLCIEKWCALCQLNHTNVSFDKFIWKTDYSRFLYFLVNFFWILWRNFLEPKGVKDEVKQTRWAQSRSGSGVGGPGRSGGLGGRPRSRGPTGP